MVEGGAVQEMDLDSAIAQVQSLVAAGSKLKDAASEVADATGLGKRDLYEGTLKAR